MVSLPVRKGACEKSMHTIIPRNELLVKQRGGLLLQLLFERIPQDSSPQAPTVGNKPEKQQSENGGKRRERLQSPLQQRLVSNSDKLRPKYLSGKQLP